MDQQHAFSDAFAPPAGTAGLLGSSGAIGADRGRYPGVAGELSRDKAEPAAALWLQAVHDMRGLLGVVSNATLLLRRPGSDERRAELLVVLDRSVGALRNLLNGVADLAALDAVQERPMLRTVDVATVLDGMCANLRVLAASRGLYLDSRGPASLVAESDSLMVTRMVQNLMLNAISYTRAGGVTLTWGPCGEGQAAQWYFEVCDVPYFAAGTPAVSVAFAPLNVAAPEGGQGIGLSIVRRLCGALGGTMQIVCSSAGRSTRIRLPRRYAGSFDELTFAAIGHRP
jgi:two-component system CheB/CheR fusion protein